MTNESNIRLMYTGKHIRIGIHKSSNLIYFQPIKQTHIWYRFDPGYYEDYTEFLDDYLQYKTYEN